MKSVVDRRVFVGSVVAGLPLMAGAGAGVLAQSRGAGRGAAAPHVHPAGDNADAVMDHLVRQMAAAHNRTRREPRGEDARALAASLRTLGVYMRTQDFDTAMKGAIREAIDRDGRHALITREPDLDGIQAEVERYGVQMPAGWRSQFVPSDMRKRTAALERLLAEGVTPISDRVATLLERVAPAIDRRNGTVVRVAFSRQDAEWHAGFCEQLMKEMGETKDFIALYCGLSAVVGIFMKYPCVAVSLAYLSLLSVDIAMGC